MRSNGHSKRGIGSAVQDVPEAQDNRAYGILKPNYIEDNWKQQEMPSMARDFVNPGDKPLQLLMRTNLFSDQEINAISLFMYKCDQIKWQEGKDLLLAKLAGRRSLNGLSMQQLLALGIGSYPPQGIAAALQDKKPQGVPPPGSQEDK